MQEKVEQSKTTPVSSSYPEMVPGGLGVLKSPIFWSAANFATVAAVTTTGVVCVQSPIKTMLTSLSKSNALFPAYKGGSLGFIRMMYTGTRASLGSNSIRSAYAAETKSNRIEPIKEELTKEETHVEMRAQMTYVASAAFGEVAVIQIPATVSDYRKANIIPANFKWWTPYNVVQLLKGGFGIKYCSSLVGCYTLCVIEPKYAEHFSFVSPHLARFMSGAFSGMSAAIVNYPIAALIDYTQVRTQLVDGKLVNKGVISSLSDLSRMFWADPRAAAVAFFMNAGKQIPLRMISAGAAFSMVSGIGHAMGQEPLQKIVPEKYHPSISRNPNTFFSDKITVIAKPPSEELAPPQPQPKQ